VPAKKEGAGDVEGSGFACAFGVAVVVDAVGGVVVEWERYGSRRGTVGNVVAAGTGLGCAAEGVAGAVATGVERNVVVVVVTAAVSVVAVLVVVAAGVVVIVAVMVTVVESLLVERKYVAVAVVTTVVTLCRFGDEIDEASCCTC
jgi:hypothetical protein